MKKRLPILFLYISLAICAYSASSSGRTHIFWYKARANNYSLTDCNPGPCLPEDAIIHEEKMATGYVVMGTREHKPNIRLGHPGGNNMKSAACYIWSKGVEKFEKGRAELALFRGEFVDFWSYGAASCWAGTLYVRCGVADFSGTIKAYGGVNTISDSAIWLDLTNQIRESMGFNSQMDTLMAEEIKRVPVPAGRTSRSTPSPLDGKFFGMDITRQINWILAHPGGQYAVVFIPIKGKQGSGGVYLYTSEASLEPVLPYINPWTRDGNTGHIVIKEGPANPLVVKKRSDFSVIKQKSSAPIEWLHPRPYSVIRGNTITLEVAVRGKKARREVRHVTFYASYFDSNLILQDDLNIPVVKNPPYRILWDCSHLPDHNVGKLSLSCDIVREGAPDTSISLRKFVLDRNLKRNPKSLASFLCSRPVLIDGRLNEWYKKDGARFSANDNQVEVYSQWDREYLYFGAKVSDKSILNYTLPGSQRIGLLYEEDEMEIFLDPAHTRSEIMDTTHKQFLIGASGMTYQVTRNKENVMENFSPEVRCSVRVHGTLNEAKDTDTCYVIEYAIPWKTIGVSPNKDMTMGLEIWHIDLDSVNSRFYHGSWSGMIPSNLQNPSEWGSIQLCGKRGGYFKWAFIGLGIAAVSILVVIIAIRSKKHIKKKGETLKERIHRAEALLEKAEDLAKNVGDKGEYLQKLEQSNQELEEFARVTSHDLQEPLRKIESFGDRLHTKFGEQLDSQGRDYLSRMQGASSRMRELINGLLSLSRISSQAEPFEPVDLNETIAEVASDLQSRIEKEGASVKCEHLPIVEADVMQMRQLFQNLIGNALKFKQEGISPVVKVTSKAIAEYGPEHEKRWEIAVTDNGIGFDGQYAQRIFQPFERLHGREAYEGTGLGLSICQKIVKRHAGAIMAKSQPGEGTTFTITLPEKQQRQVS